METTHLSQELLQEHANTHGLRIMDHRNPEKWAEMINRNNGMCPCGKMCPCDECTCKFYEKIEMFNVPEIGKAIDALELTKNVIKETTPNEPDKTIESIDTAIEIVTNDSENHTCGRCADYMNGLKRKLEFLKNECGIDQDSCEMEKAATISRIELMQDTFRAADEEVGKEPIKEEKTEEIKIGTLEESLRNAENSLSQGDNNEKEEGYSGFHDCIAKNIHENLEELPKTGRMCVATKMCGKRKLTKEEAIAECTENDE